MGNTASVIPDDDEANRGSSPVPPTIADPTPSPGIDGRSQQPSTNTHPEFSNLNSIERDGNGEATSGTASGTVSGPPRTSTYAERNSPANHQGEPHDEQPIVGNGKEDRNSIKSSDHADAAEIAAGDITRRAIALRVDEDLLDDGGGESAGKTVARPADNTLVASEGRDDGKSSFSKTASERKIESLERPLSDTNKELQKDGTLRSSARHSDSERVGGGGGSAKESASVRCVDGNRRSSPEQATVQSRKRDSGGSIKRSLPGDGGSEEGENLQDSNAEAAAPGKRHHRRRHHHRRTKSSKTLNIGHGDEDNTGAASNRASDVLGQQDKVKLLLEFIPYFGTGDTSRDNMVRSILSAADPEELAGDRDEYENTLLILACQYRCKVLVPIILARGEGAIDVNAVNSAGACALHFACYKDSICVATAFLLLERGAQPEVIENTYGCTPLHYAAGAGDIALCRRLVEGGAKASTWDFYQYTAVDYAKQSGSADCIAYLERISAPGDANGGQTTVKFSGGANRGGIVTGIGDDMAVFSRADSFESAGGEDEGSGTAGKPTLLRQATAESDEFSIGGEDSGGGGEGYWGRQRDPASGMTYYLNEKTGESMWEKDLLAQAKALGEDGRGGDQVSPQLEQWLKQQTHRTRLVAFLSRHDPLKLMQADDMLKKRLGDEEAFFSELTKKYNVEEDPRMAELSKDAATGFRGRQRTLATTTDATCPTNSPSHGNAVVKAVGWVARDARVGGGGGRPPTAPSHGPGRRTGGRPAAAEGSPGTLGSPGSAQALVATASMQKVVPTAPALSPEEVKKFHEQTQKVNNEESSASPKQTVSLSKKLWETAQEMIRSLPSPNSRLEDARIAHEETLEAERQAHRDKAAEGEGTIARLEHDLKESSAEGERLKASNDESKGTIKSLAREVELKLASQSGAAKELSQEAEALRAELKSAVDATQALSDQADREQSGAAAAAESSRREAEAKAKEESGVVQACQASVAQAKAAADRAYRDFENLQRSQQQEIEGRLGKELAVLQKEVATAKAKSATDISRAQSDAVAAKTKAEAATALWANVGAQRERMGVELQRAALTAERNGLLQGLVASESERRKMLHNKIEDLKGKIRVYVRVRPFSQKERDRGCKEAVETQGKQSIAVQDPRVKEDKNFEFDQVWAGTEENGNNQVNIFKDTGYLVTSAVDGYNVCIFAYGQTGSGKTYTMFGAGGIGGGVDAASGQCDGTAGVTPRAVLELFRVLKEREGQYEYSVKVSMFELYRDGLRDLLAKKGSNTKLVIKLAEHSGTGLVVVEGGVEKNANSIEAMIATIQAGAEGRTVSSTQMNSDSSRSHLLCSIVVSSTNRRTGSCIRGKLTLVDLAGSERVGKSGASGDQLKEAQSINKSLSALGDVIGALTTGVKHIPYRNHALTMMMSDSLGGNSKTLMFVCASPADYNASETINALQFAARCKSVTNSVGAGGAAAAAQVQALRRELQKLKGEGGDKGPANTPTKLARPL